MINKSQEYKSAIVGDARRMYSLAVVDLIDPDIEYGTVSSASEAEYSQSSQIHNKYFDNPPKMATLEQDRWKLDGTFDIYPDSPSEMTGESGYLSQELSGSDGTFANTQYVEMSFSNVSVLQAFSIYFPNNDYDGIPSNFTVYVKQGGTAYFQKAITGNAKSTISFTGFTVNNPDAIRIEVTKMSKPYRRFRVIEIVPGIYERWTDDILASISVKQQVDFSCTSLPYGTCTLTMDNQSRRFEPRSKAGLFQSIEERQPVPVSFGVLLDDGSIDYTQVGVFYQYSTGWKSGDNGLTMTWNLVDIIGLLASRKYKVPDTLPTTLDGWISSVVSQLGESFANKYTIDSAYSSVSVTVNDASDVQNATCGDMIRNLAMAVGCFPRADSETGCLAIEPLWKQGNYITLDNINEYPKMSANNDIALISFTLANSSKTVYNISGNNSASSQTISVQNPFIRTEAQALVAAQNIMACFGGNIITISGRGDMSSECGDVDSIQLDESSATAARRKSQDFGFSDGVMKGLQSTLIQPDGSLLYNTCVVIKEDGTWTAPTGVSQLFVSLVGGGDAGTDGTDGTWNDNGENGTDGLGGLVWYSNININDGQTFDCTIGSGGTDGGNGAATLFGSYSSANGSRYSPAYTDARSGESYARSGVSSPLANTGDGGAAGRAGRKGEKHTEEKEITFPIFGTITYDKEIIDSNPSQGTSGKDGASGCIVIWYQKT